MTVGLIQWSVPSLLPGSVRYYSAFRPQRQAKFLDFLEIHFYPFATGPYEYRSDSDEAANLAYLEGVVSEVTSQANRLCWRNSDGMAAESLNSIAVFILPRPRAQQARYCRRLVEVSSPYATGWLNWGFHDQPEATDCSELTGLVTADGKAKAWGKSFAELAARNPSPVTELSWPVRPPLDWDACLTSTSAAKEFRQKYLEAFESAESVEALTPPHHRVSLVGSARHRRRQQFAGGNAADQSVVDCLEQSILVEWFGQKIQTFRQKVAVSGLFGIVSGSVNDFQFRLKSEQTFSQERTAHAARHDDISNQQANLALLRFPVKQGLARGTRGQHAVTMAQQCRTNVHPAHALHPQPRGWLRQVPAWLVEF